MTAVRAAAVVIGAVAMVAMPVRPAASDEVIPPICYLRSILVDRLSVKFSEKRIDGKLQPDGMVLEFFHSSENGGTYTFLKTKPTGISCVINAGKGWILRPAYSL